MENLPFPLSEHDVVQLLQTHAAVLADVIDVLKTEDLTAARIAEVLARLLVIRPEIIDDIVARGMRWPLEKAAATSLISKAMLAKPIIEATAQAIPVPELLEIGRAVLKPLSVRLSGNGGLH